MVRPGSTTASAKPLVDARARSRSYPTPNGPTATGPTRTRADVARVEDRTFICSQAGDRRRPDQQLARPCQGECETLLNGLIYAGCMRGRTMYVVTITMGPLGSEIAHIGVERDLTLSYVAVSMRIHPWPAWEQRCPRSVLGEPTVTSFPASLRGCAPRIGAKPMCHGPATPRTKYIVQLPETREDHLLRLGLRRQRPAGQEVLCPAHRLGHGPRQRLDG